MTSTLGTKRAKEGQTLERRTACDPISTQMNGNQALPLRWQGREKGKGPVAQGVQKRR